MSNYSNLLEAKNQSIRILWFSLGLIGFLAVFMGIGWLLSPSSLRIHIPPDLSRGAVLSSEEIRKPNVYIFTLYIWQQLNRWETNGVTDYEDKLHMLKNYLTPSCYQNRMDDFLQKKNARELQSRERSVWEIPGRGFSDERVFVQGADSWVVYLDLHIKESMLGQDIKDVFVNYPLRVVRYNVDPEGNPWGLALDCLIDTARIIEVDNKEGDI